MRAPARGDDRPPHLTRRGVERLQEARDDHAFLRSDATSLAGTPDRAVWWTFAGLLANQRLAELLHARLGEHPDFEQAILLAAAHFADRGLRPAIVEKDYFVTEALRAIADASGDKVLFKGGTSLSKGWDLIDRFSEDIDLFLDPLAFAPPLSPRGIDRELKVLRDAVGGIPAMEPIPGCDPRPRRRRRTAADGETRRSGRIEKLVAEVAPPSLVLAPADGATRARCPR